MTIRGFCLFAGISRQTFLNYEKDERYLDIVTRIKDIIVEGASADLFNVNIIARELGLAEKTDMTLKTLPDDIQRNIDEMSAEDIAALMGDDR